MSANTPTVPEAPYIGRDIYPPTYQLVRHLISFLKWRFSKLPSGAYQWKPETESSPDQAGSEVFISADTPINPQQVGQRPAITISRGPATFQGAGIGDWAYTDLATGGKVRMDIIPTMAMINVLSRLPVEAERLAWFCLEQIWTFREEITATESCIFNIGGKPSISPPTPAGALVESTDFEWTVVVVSFPTYLQQSTSKVPLNSKIFNKISVQGVTIPQAVAIANAVPTAIISPLQGTAINQPVGGVPAAPAAPAASISGPSTTTSTSGSPALLPDSGAVSGSALPQTGANEAQSTGPLTLTVEITS